MALPGFMGDAGPDGVQAVSDSHPISSTVRNVRRLFSRYVLVHPSGTFTMRIKVSTRNLGRVERLLASAVACDIVQCSASKRFVFTRRMVNASRGTIVYTESKDFRSRIAAVKGAVREFGGELREVLHLSRFVQARDVSISTTQRFVEVTFADKRVDVFDNSDRSFPARIDDSGSINWQLHPISSWPLIGAGLVMRRYRNLLPEGLKVRDPLAAALSAMLVGAARVPAAGC